MSMPEIANKTLNHIAAAFLMALYQGESGGDYTILYGGGHFTPEMCTGKNGFPIWDGLNDSHAAGAPQFEPETWAWVSDACKVADFSPENQDDTAWYLAQHDFFAHTHLDLISELDMDNLSEVARILSGTWTSLNETDFPPRFKAAMAQLQSMHTC